MFPQFTNTAASLTRATALIHRVGTDAYLYDDPEDANIASLLDSKFEAEKVQGLKRLIALLSQGVDVSNFFPQVVKNVASTSLEIKKLVYIYLVHYAERRPDEALLSINSFQKDLSDLNPLVRGWSLRAMSGIRVRVVVPLVVMAVHKCSRDPSPYVRQCAAHAIPKIFALDREAHAEALEELVCLFLNDSSAGVVGAAAAAFIVVCPDHLSLLGPMFRKLCEMLLDVEEWGQVVLMDILMRYAVARYGAPRDSVFLSSSSSHTQIQERPELLPEDASEKVDLSADVRGFLHCTAPLLWSQNSAVVMATAAVHWVFASKTDLKKIVKPLLFLLRSSYDSQYVVLANIATFASTASSLFEPYYEEFFIRTSDTEPLRALKLDILTAIATESSIHPILREFQAYLRNPDRQFAADTVNAIGRCAVRLPAVASSCVEGLLMLAKGAIISSDRIEEAANGEDNSNLSAHGDLKNSVSEKYSREAAVVAQAVLALRTIVQQHPAEQEEVFARLVRTLDHVKVPKARAVVIWMVGEYGVSSGRVSQMLPVLLRYLAGSFIKEANESKLQILNCAAKVVLQLEGAPDSPLVRTATLVLQHVINLGSQDLNNDIRDRARLLCHLLTSQSRPRLQNVRNEHHPDSAERLLALESSTEPVQQEKLKEPVDRNGNTVSALSEDKAAKVLAKLAHQILLVPKSPPVLPALAPDRSAFLPGSMSHIVHHKAPGYAELPDPCSIRAPDLHSQENLGEAAKDLQLSRGGAHHDRLASDYSDSASDEGQSDVSSTGSRNWSSDGYSDQEGGAAHDSGVENRSMNNQHQGRRRLAQTEENLAPLISIDDEAPDGQENTSLGGINRGLEGLQLNAATNLESWLGAPDTEMTDTSTMKVAEGSSYLTLSLKPIHPVFKRQTLLDFTNGEGLDVRYSFTRMPSVSSQGMVCVRLYLQNRSAEPMLGITVRASEVVAASVAPEADDQVQAGTTEESKTVLPLEEISNLNPGDTKEGDVHIDFKHQLTPAKLEIVCDGKVYPVKLTPEVGALVSPLLLSMDAFTSAEQSISGMHESSRRCYLRNILSEPLQSSNTAGQTGEDKAFVVSRKIAAQVLSIAHVDIVSVTLPIASSSVVQFGGQTDLTGLKLRFCGETLTGSVTCLISVTVMAKTENDSDTNDLPVLIKVNCEDTIFGLNLLRKLHQDLSS